jgi:uridine kinase/ribulose-5-phosphate 4-epimerase/fuculose-1-phosphate aldolase
MLINISGSSGVGKTTIAKMLILLLSDLNKKVLHLSGDDLHKWERQDDRWKNLTHLNPEANNIDLGKKHLFSLLNNSYIIRNVYDHNTGKFIKDIKFEPADIILNEGLHALYDFDVCELADLNIFVNTDVELTKEWKMSRDIESRGYTEEQVLSIMKMRDKDDKKYIQPQIENADIIVNFSKKPYDSVDMKIFSNVEESDLMIKLQNFYDLHKGFLMTCRSLSFEYDLIQGAGGNLSYKFDDKIVITSSGHTMSDVSMLNGYSVCNLNGVPIDDTQKRPSMEIKLHTQIDNPVVLHTHPIYLNIILCSENSEEIISNILKGYDYISYVSPGEELAVAFSKSPKNKIVLLENHGLVCCGDTFEEVLDNSLKINKLCKDWLVKNTRTFTNYSTIFKTSNNKNFIFPDAVILEEENSSINNYMLHIQKEVGLNPRYLNSDEIQKLRDMEEEKYRRSLV